MLLFLNASGNIVFWTFLIWNKIWQGMVSIREEEVMWKMKQYVLREEQENKDDM